MEDILSNNIKFLPGVGEKRAKLLSQELGINTFRDLLYFFPFRWIDKSAVYPISKIVTGGVANGTYIQVRGVITNTKILGEGGKKRFSATLQDATGSIEIIYFSGLRWITTKILIGCEFIVFGRASCYNGKFSFVHPEVSSPAEAVNYGSGTMSGIYSLTEKMRNTGLGVRQITKLQHTLIESVLPQIQETLPTELLKRKGLCSLPFALSNIHFPQNNSALLKAQTRLKFEELFYLQLSLLYQKSARESMANGIVMERIGENFNKCYNALPYQLTEAQKRVIKEMRADMKSGRQMNRLLQGDVGSGKTLVAVLLALIAIDNGYQTCIMAPTEILANQHYQSVKKFLEPTGATVALLTGSTTPKNRNEILKKLANKEIDLLVGTHALIEERVKFNNIGFAIIDEQHRFGVEQRSRLWNKNSQKFPHVLVMTATPIPRTLAMTLYGDLDVSIIDELPPGRRPIKTIHTYDTNRQKVYDFVKQQLALGRQAYIVYPLIKESEKMDYENLEKGYLEVVKAFPEYITAVVHGQQKRENKEHDMQLFVEGKANILVATSVIEVGVDVPNATVMIIESAERFGLSPLHQLRGRVGRGGEQSFCILMSGHKLSSESRKRIEIMCSTADGFVIAEEDMKMRGAGDLQGTAQSGLAIDLHIASLSGDYKLLENARITAQKILSDDPHLTKRENNLLVNQLNILRGAGKEPKDYSQIS